MRIITNAMTAQFKKHLADEEKSRATIAKYTKDIEKFSEYANGAPISKDEVVRYKQMLAEHYAARSVNSKIASLNSFFEFLGWYDCKVKSLKLQRETYVPEEKELTKSEYCRLVTAAGNNARLRLILETICSTGIRISELEYFTVEAVRRGTVTVRCKGKTRDVFVPKMLQKLLIGYAKKKKIVSGIIFCTRTGKAVDRSNIWTQMKKLCKKARVNSSKVFPHNLRKLFARTFYRMKRDIAKLADVLGHSSINTTRIYIVTTGREHRRIVDRMQLII